MKRIARRLVWALVVVLGVTTASFAIALVLPGDPARMLAGAQAPPADVARIRQAYGLDKPVWTRFALYARHLVHSGPPKVPGKRDAKHASCAVVGPLHVDLGFSATYRKPVVELLGDKVPRSIELGLAALAVQLLLGAGMGLLAAARRGTWVDEAVVATALVGVSAPTFVLGLALQYLFAYRLRLLPYDGYGATTTEHLRSIVLPALTLGIFGAAVYARLVRDEVSAFARADFARTARAKGASRFRVLVVHAFRAAILPIATLVALDLGSLIGGAIVIEKLFRWPGVGQLAVDALLNRDGPVIVGTVLFSSAAMVASLIAVDLVGPLLDPRTREE